MLKIIISVMFITSVRIILNIFFMFRSYKGIYSIVHIAAMNKKCGKNKFELIALAWQMITSII